MSFLNSTLNNSMHPASLIEFQPS